MAGIHISVTISLLYYIIDDMAVLYTSHKRIHNYQMHCLLVTNTLILYIDYIYTIEFKQVQFTIFIIYSNVCKSSAAVCYRPT